MKHSALEAPIAGRGKVLCVRGQQNPWSQLYIVKAATRLVSRFEDDPTARPLPAGTIIIANTISAAFMVDEVQNFVIDQDEIKAIAPAEFEQRILPIPPWAELGTDFRGETLRLNAHGGTTTQTREAWEKEQESERNFFRGAMRSMEVDVTSKEVEEEDPDFEVKGDAPAAPELEVPVRTLTRGKRQPKGSKGNPEADATEDLE